MQIIFNCFVVSATGSKEVYTESYQLYTASGIGKDDFRIFRFHDTNSFKHFFLVEAIKWKSSYDHFIKDNAQREPVG